MKHKNLQSLFLLTFCFASVSISAQTASGRLSLNKGQRLQVDNTVKSVVTIEMMGQSQEITTDAATVKQIEVKEKKDTSYIIASRITKMLTNVGGMMGQSFSFDSDKKEDYDTEMGKAMKGQVNVTKDKELNYQGRETNVKNDVDSAEAGNPMMDMMKNMGGKSDGVSTADVFLVLPGGKKSGDTWMDSTIVEGIKTYKTYTIKEIKDNNATVTLAGTMTTNKMVEAQGMEMTIAMESKLSGEALVDINTGVIKQNTFAMDGTGTMDMMGQSVPMTVKVTTVTAVKGL